MAKYKVLSNKKMAEIIEEIKMMLHASRDGMRNKKLDTKNISFHIANDGGYSAEAFGILRALRVLGYGYFGSVNLDGIQENNGGRIPEHNLKWWMAELEQEVLKEEGFHDKTHRCDWCLNKYHKDDTRVKNYGTGEVFDKNPKIPTDVQIMYKA